MAELNVQEEVEVKTEFEAADNFKFLLDHLNSDVILDDKYLLIKNEEFIENLCNNLESENYFTDFGNSEEIVKGINTPVIYPKDALMEICEEETKHILSSPKLQFKDDSSCPASKDGFNKNIIIKEENPEEDQNEAIFWECTLCLFSAPSKGYLKHHMLLEHIEGPDTDSFIEEFRNGEVYTCYFCPFNSTSAEECKNHIKYNHSVVPTRSTRKSTRELGSVQFTSNREENDYTMEIRIAPVKDFISKSDLSCKICLLVTSSREDLHNHMVQYHGQKLLECTHCDFFTVCKSTLKRHKMSHSKVFKCKFCNFSTYDISTFESHKLSHTELKPFPCDECHFRAKSKDSLRQHKKIHSGNMPFLCSYCGYKAGKKSRIIRHVRIHTGERPYACPHCIFSCNQRSTLKIHIRRHTGEKPYECNLCSFKAVSRCSLNAHLKKHNSSKGKKYICSVCEQIYFTKTAFLKHERSHEEEAAMGGYMKPITNKKRKSDYLAETAISSYISAVFPKQEKKRLRASSRSTRKSKNSIVEDIPTSPIAKLYKCTGCSYRSSKFSELSDHMLSHKKSEDGMSSPVIPKNYRCTPCNISFSGKREMKNHLKEKHIKKEEELTISL